MAKNPLLSMSVPEKRMIKELEEELVKAGVARSCQHMKDCKKDVLFKFREELKDRSAEVAANFLAEKAEKILKRL